MSMLRQFPERKLEKLFDEWSRLADLARHAYRNGGATTEYDSLCTSRDAAWDKYIAAAKLDEHYEEEAKHEESMRGVRECENVDE